MVERFFNPLAGIAVVQHYLTGAYLSGGIYLPKNNCARPVFAGAYSVTANQLIGFIKPKQHN